MKKFYQSALVAAVSFVFAGSVFAAQNQNAQNPTDPQKPANASSQQAPQENASANNNAAPNQQQNAANQQQSAAANPAQQQNQAQ